MHYGIVIIQHSTISSLAICLNAAIHSNLPFILQSLLGKKQKQTNYRNYIKYTCYNLPARKWVKRKAGRNDGI